MDDRKAEAGKAGVLSEPLRRREAATAKAEYETAGARDEKTRARKELFADKDRMAEKPANAAKAAPSAAPAPPPVYSPVLPSGKPQAPVEDTVISSDTRYRITPSGAVQKTSPLVGRRRRNFRRFRISAPATTCGCRCNSSCNSTAAAMSRM
jgi:hypothetical protein